VAAAVSRAWQEEQAGALAAVNWCGAWHFWHARLPAWKAVSLVAWVWQRLHVTGERALG
jgi:hypothetical protein